MGMAGVSTLCVDTLHLLSLARFALARLELNFFKNALRAIRFVLREACFDFHELAVLRCFRVRLRLLLVSLTVRKAS